MAKRRKSLIGHLNKKIKNNINDLNDVEVFKSKRYELKSFGVRECKMCSEDSPLQTKVITVVNPKKRKIVDLQEKTASNTQMNISVSEVQRPEKQLKTNVWTNQRNTEKEDILSEKSSIRNTDKGKMYTQIHPYNPKERHRRSNGTPQTKENFIVVNRNMKLYNLDNRKKLPSFQILQKDISDKSIKINSVANRPEQPKHVNITIPNNLLKPIGYKELSHTVNGEDVVIECETNFDDNRTVVETAGKIMESYPTDDSEMIDYSQQKVIIYDNNKSVPGNITINYDHNYETNGVINQPKIAPNRENKRSNSLQENQNIDIDDDILKTLDEYFNCFDLTEMSDLFSDTYQDTPNKLEEEVPASQNEWLDYETHTNGYTGHPYMMMNGVATSMVCFLCDWLGKVSDYETHVRKNHADHILNTQDSLLSIAVNFGDMYKECPEQKLFIEHDQRLFILYLRYKFPDVILPIILEIPPCGQTVIENTGYVEKFYLQVNNLTKKQGMVWSGVIESMNTYGRPLDMNVFSNRKHGVFEISMRSLDLIPDDVPNHVIPQYLAGCIIEIHILIEKLPVEQ